jgi:hypothetical protein
MAVETRHMMGGNNPVADLETGNSVTDFNHLAAYLMAKHQRRFLDAVPLHGITAAHGTGENFQQQLTRPDPWHRKLFNSDIPVIVIHCHAHEKYHPT